MPFILFYWIYGGKNNKLLVFCIFLAQQKHWNKKKQINTFTEIYKNIKIIKFQTKIIIYHKYHVGSLNSKFKDIVVVLFGGGVS